MSLMASPTFAAETITISSNGQQTAVLELYTSEGCSSCPSADRWLAALVEVPNDELDVLALAFHVDYWDYLGWKDRFGSPRYTSRQRQLGSDNNQRTIYTPEFFVDGKEARGTRNVLDKIRTANNQAAAIQLKLSISKSSDSLQIDLISVTRDAIDQPLLHRYFVYENELMSDVTRGENSGERLLHQQVVRYMSPELDLENSNHHTINIDSEWRLENIGVAALVTAPGARDYLQVVHSPITALLDQ